MQAGPTPTVFCARCGAPMLHVALGDGFAYACNGCGAVFLSLAHATRVRRGLDRAAPVLAEQGAGSLPTVDPAQDTTHLACPCCRRPMTPEWVPTQSQPMRIDHCAAHGTFFDAHELAALAPPKPRAAHPPTGRERGSSSGEVNGFGDAALEVVAALLLGSD